MLCVSVGDSCGLALGISREAALEHSPGASALGWSDTDRCPESGTGC